MVAILEHMTALSDPTRCRMLLLLEKHELTVSELCAVLQMPQSSVSRHLKTLADDDWVASRRDGTSRFYSMPVDDLDAGARRLWSLIREQVAGAPGAGQDARRLRGVLGRRREKSQEFFASAAGEWDRLRMELFGDRFHLWALLGLIDPALVVGDLGCGTGQLSATLAPYVRRVIAVDGSTDMLDAARARSAMRATSSCGRANWRTCRSRRATWTRRCSRSCSTTRPRPPARSPRRAASCARAGGCWWSTCSRTTGRSTSSRWGTSGSASPRSRSAASWRARASRTCVRMVPAEPAAKGPTLFAAVGTRR
jgi:DNA-binding transcriptional ArsR family regulator